MLLPGVNFGRRSSSVLVIMRLSDASAGAVAGSELLRGSMSTTSVNSTCREAACQHSNCRKTMRRQHFIGSRTSGSEKSSASASVPGPSDEAKA